MKGFVKEIFEKISRIGRYKSSNKNKNIIYLSNQLKKQGYVVLDHLVGTDEFKSAKNDLTDAVEKKFNIEFPCLAQSKVNDYLDKDLISKNFLCTNEELKSRNLTFDYDDIESYDHMLKKYNHSTITIPIIPNIESYNIWLDSIVLDVVTEFMGFTPHMIEAYSRRNFPSKFAIMNHNWHRDTNHSQFLIKAFIFFTDCDLETGAHHYVSGSVHNKNFTNKTYYTDEEIDKVWPISSKERIVSKVPAGTIIIEDTRGLHKAGIPVKEFRDLGYVIFMPVNYIKKPNPLYNIPKDIYKNLTFKQKSFIPKQNII